mmetsp:Transcript_25068/g.40159  ORF Transcript_25068/g.40159 Transcript_25068/m.40159 type:complete len:102 (-) Transcript_25068:25-330(-)
MLSSRQRAGPYPRNRTHHLSGQPSDPRIGQGAFSYQHEVIEVYSAVKQQRSSLLKSTRTLNFAHPSSCQHSPPEQAKPRVQSSAARWHGGDPSGNLGVVAA